MARNIEFKAQAADLDAIRERARDLGAEPAGVLHQTDTFFPCTHGRLKLRQFAEGPAELIAYERSDRAQSRRSEYTRVEVPDEEGLRESLRRSLGIRAVVRKARELWLIGTTRIHLDRVEGLGDFVEVEVVLTPNQSEAQGRLEADRIQKGLGIAPDHIQSRAYVDLLESQGSNVCEA